jgi:putative membrane protein
MWKRKPLIFLLMFLFLIQWAALAFNVHDRKAWILENILLVLFVGPTIWLYFKGYLSKVSALLFFVFLSLHNIGAHYTYSLVPYNEWTMNLMGFNLNEVMGWERNHYDRFLHFLFGFVLYQPLREIFYIRFSLKGWMLSTYTLLVLVSASTAYEMIEWGAAIIFSDGTGMAFLGTQGDVWDAHKDQALALLGSFIAAIVFGTLGNSLLKSRHTENPS